MFLIFRKIAFYLAVAGFTFCFLMVRELNSAQPMSDPPKPPAANPFGSGVAASGLIEASSENISIGAPISGLVVEVMVETGDKVAAGQPLFRLDDRDLQAALPVLKASIEAAEAGVAVGEANLRKTQDQLARVRAAEASRTVSADLVEQRANEASVAQAELAKARAQVALAQAQLGQTREQIARLVVKAPRPGTILQRRIRAGQYLSFNGNTEPVLLLGSLDVLHIRVDVDEFNASRIRPEHTAKAYVKGRTAETDAITLKFVRFEPLVIPKRSLTGASDERVDTRVLQVVYALAETPKFPVYVGQQADLFINTGPAEPAPAPVASPSFNR